MIDHKLERQVVLLKILAKGCKNILLTAPLEKQPKDVKNVYIFGKQELS